MSNDDSMYLHVYGLSVPHDDVHILGTREALETLRAMLTDALDGPSGTVVQSNEFFAKDGEGFGVRITQASVDMIDRAHAPYTDEAFQDE